MERIRLSALMKDIEMGGDIDVVIAADAQRALDALQAQLRHMTKERDIQKEVADNQAWHVRDLKAQLRQLEGERDVLKRDQFATHACAKTFEQMSDESSLRRLLASLQADHARVLELVQEANYELAALFPMPDNPTFEDAFVVCGNKNPADARCVLNAYEAIHQAASLPAQPAQGGANG